uniref:Ig-like domain-containing protein n=1 Tax=Heterorhabditis bacteriophora TaxID=37862 RepID=A0A1I7X3H0_HETBA
MNFRFTDVLAFGRVRGRLRLYSTAPPETIIPHPALPPSPFIELSIDYRFYYIIFKMGFNHRYWIWWSTVILLLLRCALCTKINDNRNETGSETYISSVGPTGPLSADRLGIPRCESNYDCVYNGVCRKDADGYGRCLCPRSCPPYIPMGCKRGYNFRHHQVEQPCLVMDGSYTRKYDLSSPHCYQVRAIRVLFVQNTTVIREPTKHPFYQLNTPHCWELEIKNVQLSDSGSYLCHVTTLAGNNNQQNTVNYTIEFQVKGESSVIFQKI